jgi:hypothetical protein
VLQSINDGGVVGLQVALAAEMLLALNADPNKRESNLGGIVEEFNRRIPGLIEDVPPVENHTAMDELKAILGWTEQWPEMITKARMAVQAAARLKGQENIERAIPTSSDAYLLWKMNPVSRGKLRLALITLWEEVGLDTTRLSPHVFSFCHLYNALVQIGRLQHVDESNVFSRISKLHSQEIFMGQEPPTHPEAMLHRIQASVGQSLKTLKEKNVPESSGRGLKDSEKRSEKTHVFNTSPTIQILRQYFHEDISLLQALYRFDEEMQKDVLKRKRKSYIDELGIVPFLEKLKDLLKDALPHLYEDYLAAHADCIRLAKEMGRQMGNIHVGASTFRPPTEDKEWQEDCWHTYIMVTETMRELVDYGTHEKKSRKKASSSEPLPTPCTDIAVEILGRYLEETGPTEG